MLAYSIDAALESGLFERVVVSTDSREIAEVAIRCGAEVPYLREATLADDQTAVSAVTVDALERLDGKGAIRHVAQLLPTCPLRNAEDVRSSYRQFAESGARSQISVVRFGWLNPWWATTRDENYQMIPLFEERMTQRSQDQAPLYCPTGAIWWATADTLRRERTYHIPGRTAWEIVWTHGVDIDSFEDLEFARLLQVHTEAQAATGVPLADGTAPHDRGDTAEAR